jgi:SET domain-containing protein
VKKIMARRINRRRSAIHGNGVFALQDLPAGLRLIQYRGKLRTHAEADRMHGGGVDSGHTFLFTLNDKYLIDANIKGNTARWINHSCVPNCEAVTHVDKNGDERKDRIFIETIRAIRAGEEITYDYGITLEEPHTPRLKRIWACHCGHKQCSGTLLKPKKK